MLYQTLVHTIVLYNAETWTSKEDHKRKLSVFEMSVLRKIYGIIRRDRRRNVDIKEELEIKLDIAQCLQRQRLAYFGHVTRMSKTDIQVYCCIVIKVDSKQEADRRKRLVDRQHKGGL